MGSGGVLDEIDRRIKRVEAEIEILDERIRYLEETGAPKYRIQRKDYSLYYIILMGAWLLTGLFALFLMRNRLPEGIRVSLLPYAVLIVFLVAMPLAYYFLRSKEEEKGPTEDLEERRRAAKIVLSLFYRPLRKAVEKDDRRAIESLADEVLNNPLLAEAIVKINEGDPKRIAYALYLYSNYRPELEDEVRETLENLGNRAVKALLSTLLKD